MTIYMYMYGRVLYEECTLQFMILSWHAVGLNKHNCQRVKEIILTHATIQNVSQTIQEFVACRPIDHWTFGGRVKSALLHESHYSTICVTFVSYVLILRQFRYLSHVNTLQPRRYDRHFADDILNAFSWMKILEFVLECHWHLFPTVQLTIFQHWFR